MHGVSDIVCAGLPLRLRLVGMYVAKMFGKPVSRSDYQRHSN